MAPRQRDGGGRRRYFHESAVRLLTGHTDPVDGVAVGELDDRARRL